jgi:hypothetical protein
MTITGAMLSTFLITAGMLLGGYTWLGYFDAEASRSAASMAVTSKPSKEAPAHGGVQYSKGLMATHDRTRFIALTDESRGKAKNINLPAVKAVTKSGTAAAKPIAPVLRKAPPARGQKEAKTQKELKPRKSQQAAFQWPWNIFQ